MGEAFDVWPTPCHLWLKRAGMLSTKATVSRVFLTTLAPAAAAEIAFIVLFWLSLSRHEAQV
jgi:hypothetical protein